MLLRLLQFPVLILLVYAVIRVTLHRIDQANAELESLGHPFSLWNWLNLPALRREHRRRQIETSRTFLESRADLSLAKDLVYQEVSRLMEAGTSFEEAARKVLMEEENVSSQGRSGIPRGAGCAHRRGSVHRPAV